MKLSSPAFAHNTFIPLKFTCEGQRINPALAIEGIPKEAKTLALIVDDPDAPSGDFVHWVVYDIAITSRIEEDSIPGKQGPTAPVIRIMCLLVHLQECTATFLKYTR